MQQFLDKPLQFSGRLNSDPNPRLVVHKNRHHHAIRLADGRECGITKLFEGFALDTVNQCLIRRQKGTKDDRISLSPRAYELLRYLVEHPNRLVTQEELLEALWPEAYVQPEVLKNHVLEIRRALGDDHKNPRYIETLPRRGYRFLPVIHEPFKETERAEPTSELIGRSVELNALVGLQHSSLRGLRQIVFISGEPGIGKTALVDKFVSEAVASVPALRFARGSAVEVYGAIEPYYPMLEALRQLCTGPASSTVIETLAVQAPTWLVQLPSVLKREQRATLQREQLGATRERMLREIGDALETMAAERPLLLIFEDLHWADPSTVDLISAVARRRGLAKLMVVGTYAPVDVAFSRHPLKMVKQDLQVRRLCREIPLPPLEQPHVAEYLAAELGSENIPAGLADLVYRHSGGNPLFMVAGLEHLTDQKVLERQGERWVLRRPIEEIDDVAPDSLRQMIELRIEQLRPEHLRVLEIMSLRLKSPLPVVLGSQVSEMPLEDFERACEELVGRQVLVREAVSGDYCTGPIPSYAFRHVLYKKVVYGRIPPTRRKKLHLSMGLSAAGLHLQSPAEAETELAYQFEQGGDYARAMDYLTIASQTTARRLEMPQSAAILEHAMDLVKNVPDADGGPIEMDVSQRLAAVCSALQNPRSVDSL